jgi:hypothetical protein
LELRLPAVDGVEPVARKAVDLVARMSCGDEADHRADRDAHAADARCSAGVPAQRSGGI